jgi:protein-S-isoprenylcysteine O-methyltransferase Ste14
VRKALAVIGSAIFLVVAPGVVAGLVPWTISRWEFDAPLFGASLFRVSGGLLLAMGIVGVLECFGRFVLQGVGTPAPVFPTRHLVVAGMYRYVRNPMYVSVAATILGQGLLFGNVAVLEYGGIVWLLFHLFVLIYEEPTLRSTFGAEYEAYCARVPRWIPRFTRQPARHLG